MDMILKAEIMLFHMISAFNEACAAAMVCKPGKVGVCVVGLHLGSPKQTTTRTPAGSLRQRPLDPQHVLVTEVSPDDDDLLFVRCLAVQKVP